MLKWKYLGNLKIPVGHIFCTGSADLEKGKSKGSHGIHSLEVAFSKWTEGVTAYKMSLKGGRGREDAPVDQTRSAANINTCETSSLIGTSLKCAALERFGNFWSSMDIEPGEWIEDVETQGHM